MMASTKRRVIRTVFTKEINSINKVLQSEEVRNNLDEALISIAAKLKNLELKMEELKCLDNEIQEGLFSNPEEAEKTLEEELEKASEYSLRYFETLQRYDKLKSCLTCDVKPDTSQVLNGKLRLPKIELKKFDGEVKNWIPFWSQFSKIHGDKTIRNEDKFEYLLQAMLTESPAHKLLLGFPASAENYLKAVELLKERYGKDEYLIEYYVRELLALVLKKNENMQLTSLYDALEAQLRALETLGMTKDKYAAILYPLVESAIPESTFKIWERYRISQRTSAKDPADCLTELLVFLKVEVEGEARLKLRAGNLGNSDINTAILADEDKYTAAALVASERNTSKDLCLFCEKGSHPPQDCINAMNFSYEKKVNIIKKKNACFKCLKRGHTSARCKILVRCILCKGWHYPLLCDKSYKIDPRNKSETNLSIEDHKTETINMLTTDISTVYLQTALAYIDSGNRCKLKVRILLDSGSQKSYITKRCVDRLNLKQIKTVAVKQELFGGRKTECIQHKMYKVKLKNVESDYEFEFNALDQNNICNFVPRLEDKSVYFHLYDKGIKLNDFSDTAEVGAGVIDVLLGADCWAQVITGDFVKLTDSLVAVRTKLGWTLMGSLTGQTSISTYLVNCVTCQTNLSNFWDLELLGIGDPSTKVAKEVRNNEIIEFFNSTVTRDETGRYVVKLPFVEGGPLLETNLDTAEKRLHATTRKLKQTGKFQDYDLIIIEWLDKQIIEKVEETTSPFGTHYLPHRAVFKEHSTTKIRPVFDASCKDLYGRSLNAALEKGPNLIELLAIVLMNFRLYNCGISADIEKAFLQIKLDERDRDLLRFLWWQEGKIITFRHCRVVFGVSCSPFLLGAVLNHLFDHAPEHLKNIADKLRGTFYVDNCLAGVSNKEEYEIFKNRAQQLLSSAGFNLRGWISNVDALDPKQVENILGIRWFCFNDELACDVNINWMELGDLSKRVLLSLSQRIFDPIGFISPASLIPKMLLQKCWSLSLTWDERLPEEIFKHFNTWLQQLHYLGNCRISRKIVVNCSSTIHIFGDASKNAYASCAFLRTEVEESVQVYLVMAKCRVAPIIKSSKAGVENTLTLPRLELMAAVVSVRLGLMVRQVFERFNLPTIFWSDSSVTLSWIKGSGPWSVFVENRVREIRTHSTASQWRHVPGSMNPADLLSRGCYPQQLHESKWWEGPQWLRKNSAGWPKDLVSTEETEEEKRKIIVCAEVTSTDDSILQKLGNRFSKYSKIVRTLAWMLRFAKRKYCSRNISTEEFNDAETILFKLIQEVYFDEETRKKHLKSFNMHRDENGLIRLRTRLAGEINEFSHPILLPSKDTFVKRLIEEQHLQYKHASTSTLTVLMRERFWIIHSRRTIGTIVRRCVICRRNQAKAGEVPVSPLPKDRTNIGSTFQVTGTDLAGPLFLKQGEKCWVVIFTCAVYRAVHLELVQSLSTEAFIQALRRFIARRGRIHTLYSDNGTNFIGTRNALEQLDWKAVEKECCLQRINWKLNPPTAPWWGGFWERLIRILKDLLRKNLGHASLSFDELNTLVCECESIMNNRPLTYVSEDPNELQILKPSSFLISLGGNEVADLDRLEEISLHKRWQYLAKVRQDMRKRFKSEYLGFLRNSAEKKTKNMQKGAVVIIGSDNHKRLDWPMGVITELIEGADKKCRLAKVRTSNGIMLRPLQRLYPLELQEEGDDGEMEEEYLDTDSEEEDTAQQLTTRSGRQVKPRQLLDL